MPNSTPKVSVVIPTHNRPELVRRALESVLDQTYQNFEVIVVDDGLKKRAEQAVKSVQDERISYIQHSENKGGGAARNTGIKNANGNLIAFLDDDDQWLENKLADQVRLLKHTDEEVGFCFAAVLNKHDNNVQRTQVPSGVDNYHSFALQTFKKFLTPTLMIKAPVFASVGMFDPSLPTSQEAELMIRVTESFLGVGLNKPVAKINMLSNHTSINSDLSNRIKGREIVLKKHKQKFEKHPNSFAKHLFQMGIWHRDSGEYNQAKKRFWQAFLYSKNLRHLLHCCTMLLNAIPYKLLQKIKIA